MPQSRRVQFSVGLLVLTGAALAVAFVLFLTRDRVTTRDALFETYLRESVQGLEVGSAVRYRGVSVGRVTEIGLVSAEYRRGQNQPFASAFQLVFVRFAVNTGRVGEIPSVSDAVAQGLRARLASQGITGVVYIELDFVDAARSPVPRLPWTPVHDFIPSTPSTVAQAQTVAEALMRQLEGVDIATFMGNLDGLLTDLRRVAQGIDLGPATVEAQSLLQEVRNLLTASDIPTLMENLRATSQATRGIVEGDELRAVLEALNATTASLRDTTQRLPPTIAQVQSVLRVARGTTTDLQAELAPILRDLRNTTANLREITEALRRSPSQTLLGAPPPR